MKKALKLLLYAVTLLFTAHAFSQSKGINPDTLQAKLTLYSKISLSKLVAWT